MMTTKRSTKKNTPSNRTLKKYVKDVLINLRNQCKEREFIGKRKLVEQQNANRNSQLAEKVFSFPLYHDEHEESSRPKKKKKIAPRCIQIDDTPAKLDFMSCYVEVDENVWFVKPESEINSIETNLKDFASKIDLIADLLVKLVEVVQKNFVGTPESRILKAVREVSIRKPFPDCDEYLKMRFDDMTTNGDMSTEQIQPAKEKVKVDPLLFLSHPHSDARPRPTKRRWNFKYAKNEEKFYIKPCNHEGACTKDCLCKLKFNYCEKFCGCPPTCTNRFPGCACKGRCDSLKCICRSNQRECDLTLCGCEITSCKESMTCCKNVALFQNVKKPLEVKTSSINGAGLGCFTKVFIEKDEYIDEYTGEIITNRETERREEKYKTARCSYVSAFTEDYNIDATRKGNNTRFINNDSINPNCFACLKNVCGVFRIGFFAKRDIQAGEELFYDYNYSKQDQQYYLDPEKKLK